jgi:Ca2+-transporting ATPase
MPEHHSRNTEAAHKGLTSAEAERSRQKHGPNVLTPPQRDPWWRLYLEKFDDPVIRILMIAAVIAVGVGAVDGKYLEGIGILCAIFLATTLAFLNEYRANREFDILNEVSDDVSVKVMRDGRYSSVPRRDVVVGDVVLIEAGEEAPADGVLLEAVSLQVDESRLTGESLPADKRVMGRGVPGSLADAAYPENRILRSTMIADGHGIIRVTAVGDSTEIGKTARAAAEKPEEPTPLTRQLDRLSKVIGVFAFGVAGLLFIALVTRGVLTNELQLLPAHWVFVGILLVSAMVMALHAWLPSVFDALQLMGRSPRPPAWLTEPGVKDWLRTVVTGAIIFATGSSAAIGMGWMSASPSEWISRSAGGEFLTFFMVAVTLVVVAIPEGLAMSVTLSLAYSMRKMIASNNLVRRMHACETIGAASVICSDKTGTLTLNQMQVHAAHFPALVHSKATGTPALTGGTGDVVSEGIAANSTANLTREPNRTSRVLGNPTEGAALRWLDDHSVDYLPLRKSFRVEQQWTFSTERKYMATLGASSRLDTRVLHVKGAPELVLSRCTHLLSDNGPQDLGEYRADIESKLQESQERGMRTLAFAYRPAQEDGEHIDLDEITRDLVWIGFVAISDPVRPEVPDAIRACRKAGILVQLVTGDNPLTAQEIGRQAGLWEDNDPPTRHFTGGEFDCLDGDEALEEAKNLKILSRARPLDKLRLVRLHQERGRVVAVTGDGTNDAPALNHANVGLAMGCSGTAVAKEASDMVLLDDSFGSVVKGIMWGRSLYENIQRFIVFQLTINVAALVIVFLGPFLGVKLPLTVVQMLWVNLIMDTFAALALATEPPHWDVMNRPPRRPKDFIVTKSMAKNIFGVAGAFLVVLVSSLLIFQHVDVRPGFVIERAANADEVAVLSPYELTVFFTCFVLLQFWNLFNVRCIGRAHSAFHRITRNRGFMLIAAAILVGQFLVVQVGGNIFRTVPLSIRDWAIILAATSVVLWSGEVWRLLERLRLADRE